MAKFVGFVGTIRGKVGTTVFTKGEKGLSYGRSYQPQVFNPKTVGQVDQRAKMNLVGRMSQVTPKALLIGLGEGSNRQRRSAFNKMLLNAAVVDRSDITNIVAKIEPGNIIFSTGMVSVAATAAAPVVSANAVSVALTLGDAALAGIYGERVVVAVIDPESKGGYSQVKFVDKVLDSTSAATVSVSFPVAIKAESLVCVYRLPFELNETGVSYRTSSLNNDGVDVIASMMMSREFVRDFGLSVLHSSSVFTNA